MSGPEASRPYVEAAAPEHPSLLDPTHRMDALFGVVNIPNVVWIDEQGTVVRPAEPGWPGGQAVRLRTLSDAMPEVGRARNAPRQPDAGFDLRATLSSGQDRTSYPDAVRDWVEMGADSRFALTPDEVVVRSQPRSTDASRAAAHFELAQELWRTGRRELAIEHFRHSHRLQPDNWTYKRQAWSAASHERVGGDVGRFVQAPVKGEEDDWPFDSDFRSDVAVLGPGTYYPKTL
jgi:tetratricopeptide (TPR) repeat protein